MQLNSFPDSLKFSALRNRGSTLKRDLAQAYQELATGRRSNKEIIRNLSGRIGDAQLVRRDIEKIEKRETSFAIGLGRASFVQNSLDQVLSSVGTIPEDLKSAVGRDDGFQLRTVAQLAESSLQRVTSALNVQQGRRFLYSGDATDRPAIAPAQEILDEVRTAISGLNTAAEINAAMDTFFGAGGTFETSIYNGGAGEAAQIEITEGDNVKLEVKADEQAFRDIIRGLAIGVVVSEAGLNDEESSALVADASQKMVDGVDEVAILISETGLSEQRIITAQTRNNAEIVVLNEAYNAMTGRDGFDAATRAQEIEVQLQTTYTITSRLAQLTFNNYIR